MKIKTNGKLGRFPKYLSAHAIAKHFGDVKNIIDPESITWETISMWESWVSPELINEVVFKILQKNREDLLSKRAFRRCGRKLKAFYVFQLTRDNRPVKTGTRYGVNCGDIHEKADCYYAQIVLEWMPDLDIVEAVTVFPTEKIDCRDKLFTISLK